MIKGCASFKLKQRVSAKIILFLLKIEDDSCSLFLTSRFMMWIDSKYAKCNFKTKSLTHTAIFDFQNISYYFMTYTCHEFLCFITISARYIYLIVKYCAVFSR